MSRAHEKLTMPSSTPVAHTIMRLCPALAPNKDDVCPSAVSAEDSSPITKDDGEHDDDDEEDDDDDDGGDEDDDDDGADHENLNPNGEENLPSRKV
eukprot:6431120-Prymnesium_polylepis.1